MALNTTKIIHAPVGGGRYTVTAPITQWDYGYLFLPEIDDLPATYRLDFANDEHHGTALSVYCGGETPEPSQQSSIDQLIYVANEAIDTAQESASDASASAQSASESAEQAQESARTAGLYSDTAQTYANSAEISANSASASATASAQSAEASARCSADAQDALEEFTTPTASATTLPEGSNATASYADGHFTFGIPTGATGAKGDEGAQFLGPYAELTQVALAVNGKMRGQFKITSGTQILRTEIFAISNGEALDASTDEWADEYDGYNLEEMATSIETNTSDIASLEADVSQIKEDLSALVARVTALEG